MKKFIIKSFVFSLVFGFTLIGIYYLVSARNGLTASSGDKITASKWNEMIDSITGNTTEIQNINNKFTLENRITATLTSPWSNYGNGRPNASYYKDSFGVVHLHGSVKGGSAGNTIMTLPTGYRPINRHMFIVEAWASTVGQNLARIDVGPTGQMVLQVGTCDSYLSLDGISFRTY